MFEDSVFEVTSCDRVSNLSAGTAFAVDRAGSTAYLVTCAHVIEAVGRDQVCVEGQTARVEALGDPQGPDDLAVLSAELPGARPLRLSPSSPDGGEITVRIEGPAEVVPPELLVEVPPNSEVVHDVSIRAADPGEFPLSIAVLLPHHEVLAPAFANWLPPPTYIWLESAPE